MPNLEGLKELEKRVHSFLPVLILFLAVVLIGLTILFKSLLGNDCSQLLISVGGGIIAAQLMYLIQKYFLATPLQALGEIGKEIDNGTNKLSGDINDIGKEIKRAFHGFTIDKLDMIYKECIKWVEESFNNNYFIYELCTTPNSEYYENIISGLVKKKIDGEGKLIYTRLFASGARNFKVNYFANANVPPEWKKIKPVQEVVNFYNSPPNKVAWVKIYEKKNLPTDALLIVKNDKPIYAVIELYDNLAEPWGSVLSFSTENEKFLESLYTQVKDVVKNP
jgi:hypothetical protein